MGVLQLAGQGRSAGRLFPGCWLGRRCTLRPSARRQVPRSGSARTRRLGCDCQQGQGSIGKLVWPPQSTPVENLESGGNREKRNQIGLPEVTENGGDTGKRKQRSPANRAMRCKLDGGAASAAAADEAAALLAPAELPVDGCCHIQELHLSVRLQLPRWQLVGETLRLLSRFSKPVPEGGRGGQAAREGVQLLQAAAGLLHRRQRGKALVRGGAHI